MNKNNNLEVIVILAELELQPRYARVHMVRFVYFWSTATNFQHLIEPGGCDTDVHVFPISLTKCVSVHNMLSVHSIE